MKLLYSFAFTLGFGWSGSSFAARTQTCSETLSSKKIEVVFQGFNGSGGESRRLSLEQTATELIDELSSNYFNLLARPKKIRIHFEDHLCISIFEFWAGTRASGMDVCLAPDHDQLGPLNPERLRYILAHEVAGHIIFPLNLGLEIPYFKVQAERRAQIVDLPTKKIFSELETEDPRLPPEYEWINNFEELYGDVAAVLVSENPSILPNRDFSKEYRYANWTNSDRHFALNPVRSFLWEYVLKDMIGKPDEYPTFLAKLEAVLAQEIKARISKQNASSITVSKTNQRVLRALTKAFKLSH